MEKVEQYEVMSDEESQNTNTFSKFFTFITGVERGKRNLKKMQRKIVSGISENDLKMFDNRLKR